MSVAALARELGVTSKTITNYEHGARSPDETVIRALARALEVPVEQLTAPEPDSVDAGAVSFRSLSRTSASSRRRAMAAIPDAEDVVAWLRARYRLPEVDVPEVADEDPETAAESVRRAWGLGNAPAPDMVNLLEHHGIHVFSLGVDFDDVDAFSVWRGETPFVFLSQRKSGERGRMDAAHELGHLCRHRDIETGREDEVDAQRFAAAFLMPAEDIVARVRPGATTADILELKGRWRVAAVALAHRLHQLELLTDWQYRTVVIELSQMGYRSGEPGGIPRESSDLLPALLEDARRRHATSASVLAADLKLGVGDLRKLVFDRPLVAVDGDGARSDRSRNHLRMVQ